jgi:hypothetical protein
MRANYDIMKAHPESMDTVQKGLKPRQIRYFFKSYPELKEEKKKEYEFLDMVREVFVRLDVIDHEVLDMPDGWMKKQKLQKHLKKLQEVHILEEEGLRYKKSKEHYLNHAFPYFFKRAIKETPVNWMVPRTKDVVTTLVYGRPRSKLLKSGPMRRKGRQTQRRFEEEVLEKCDEFGKNIRELHARYMDNETQVCGEKGQYDYWDTIPIIIIYPILSPGKDPTPVFSSPTANPFDLPCDTDTQETLAKEAICR